MDIVHIVFINIERKNVMNNQKYIYKKMLESEKYIYDLLGKKEKYTFLDVFKILSSFSFTKEILFEEIGLYVPTLYHYLTSIEDFSQGFISGRDDYKVYALNYGSSFAIIIVSSTDGCHIDNYYGDMFNDFTMNIYYCLDIMCSKTNCGIN